MTTFAAYKFSKVSAGNFLIGRQKRVRKRYIRTRSPHRMRRRIHYIPTAEGKDSFTASNEEEDTLHTDSRF